MGAVIRAVRKYLFEFLRHNWPVLLLGLIVIVCFAPVLFLGYAFFGEEQIGFYYPQSFFYAQAVKNGTSLLWNHAYFGGVDVSLDQFVSTYYPVYQLLFYIFSYFTAHHLYIVIGIVVGCLFAYWFGRAQGFSKPAAFVLASSYFSATTFDWLIMGTLPAQSFMILPPILFALFKIHQRKFPVLFFLLGGVALGVGFLAGFMQIVFYVYAIALLYAIFLDWQRKETDSAFGRMRVTLSFIAMTVLAFGIGGIQILSSVFLIDQTVRSSTYAIQKMHVPGLEEFLTFIFPPHIRLPFLSGGSPGFYVGALPLLMAILGLFFYRTPTSLFFAGMYIMMLGFGYYIPPFSWINNNIPPFSHMGTALRWLVPGSFLLAYLSAQGCEALLSGKITFERSRRVMKVLGWIVCGIVVFGVAASIFFSVLDARTDIQKQLLEWYFSGRVKTFPIEHYLKILQIALADAHANFSLLNWRFAIPFFLIPLSYVLIVYYLKNTVTLSGFKKSLVAIITLNIIIVFVAQFRTVLVPQSVMVREPRIVKVIRERETDTNQFRVAGFLLGDSLFWKIVSKQPLTPSEGALLQREAMVNNSNVFYGLQRLEGMEPYGMQHNHQLLYNVLSPHGLDIFDRSVLATTSGGADRAIHSDMFKTASLEEKVKNFLSNLPILSMLNVKYIYSLIPLSDPRLHETEVPPSDGFPVPMYVYENPRVMPKAYFPKNSVFVVADDALLLDRLLGIKDFGETALIECLVCPPVPSTGKKEVKVLEYKNGLARIQALTTAGGWLVFSESFAPAWTATVDGVETPIYRANYMVQAVYVPPGEHKIEFKYQGMGALKWKQLQQLLH